MTTPDFRAELQALYDDVTAERWDAMAHRAAIERAQAALAAQPQAPSDEKISEMCDWLLMLRDGPPGLASRYNERLTRIAEMLTFVATPAPVPVGERLPDRSDCDAQGRVWWLIQNASKPIPTWALGNYRINKSEWAHTHWLPYWALPLPGDQS
jgi:hypothetical protein